MLVGRGPEQLIIDRLLAGARIGESGVLVLTGEPGIGKTSLLVHAQAELSGLRVLQARGVESEGAVPFGGLLQLLRPILPLLDQIPTPQAAVLEAALLVRSPAAAQLDTDRFAVGAGTLSLISRAAEEHPLAIFIDDGHLLDRASAEAMVFTARRLLADAVAVLMSVRDDHPASDLFADLPSLQLHGLDRAAAATLLTDRFGAEPTADRVDRLHRATAGNPLALIELSGPGHDDLDALPTDAPLSIPGVLVQSFSQRIEGLGAEARTTLLVAAAEGRSVLTVMQACGRLGVSTAGLTECEAAELITLHHDQIEFRHPLVRAAVYGSATPDRLRTVHRVLAALLPPGDVDRLAWHLSEGALAPDPEIAATLDRVGRLASARGAHAVAAGAHERAAELGADPQEQAPRLAAAGEAAWLAGQTERAMSLLTQALERAEPSAARLRIRVLGLQGVIQARCGSLEAACDALLGAADDAVTSDPATAVSLLADVVGTCFFLADAAGGIRAAQRIESLLGPAIDPGAHIVGEMAVGIAYIVGGSGEKGADRIRSAVRQLSASAELRHDHLRLHWLVLGPLFLREAGTERRLINDAVQDVRTRGAVGSLPFLLFHLARDDAATDHWRRGEDSYAEGIRLASETGQTTDLAMGLAGLAWLHARQGRADDCHRAADQAVRLSLQNHIHLGRIWVEFALGDLAAGAGDPDTAISHYRRLEKLLSALRVTDADLSPGPELTEALLHVGRPSEAAVAAERSMDVARAKGQPWALARAHRATALVAPDEETTRSHFETALTLHAATPDGYEMARTQLAYGAYLRRARQRSDSRQHLQDALNRFETLGAPVWAERTAAELRATGASVRRRAADVLEELTPQERQIAHLLGAGRTTREAAAALFLSPKTVEYHLRHVYIKLGINSRADLALAFPE